MKIMKNLVFTITMLVSAQAAVAMEAPPGPTFHALAEAPAHSPSHQPLIPLNQFPGDIQRMLYAETIKGGLYPTAQTLLALARTSKQHRIYINNNMIAILESMPTSKAIELVKILRKNTFSLPILSRASVDQWCTDAQTRLTNNIELSRIIYMPYVLDPLVKLNKVREFLANKNVDLKIHAFSGSCLHKAASTGQKEIVRQLLDAGANPNDKDFEGNTPLMHSKKINSQEIMALLLQYGADRRLRNNRGQTVDDIEYDAQEIERIQRLYHDINKRSFSFADESQSFKRPRN